MEVYLRNLHTKTTNQVRDEVFIKFITLLQCCITSLQLSDMDTIQKYVINQYISSL